MSSQQLAETRCAAIQVVRNLSLHLTASDRAKLGVYEYPYTGTANPRNGEAARLAQGCGEELGLRTGLLERVPTLLQKQFLREFALALRARERRQAFEHAMRNCVFVVFMPINALAVISLGLLFEHVEALRARLDALWTPIGVSLVIGSLLFSYVLVKRKIGHYANNPEVASPYDTEKDRALARTIYFLALLMSVGLITFVFMP